MSNHLVKHPCLGSIKGCSMAHSDSKGLPTKEARERLVKEHEECWEREWLYTHEHS